MKRPPISPQSFRIHYRDGRVETVEARTCMKIGDDHVFYSEKSGETLRVPAAAVLRVESYSHVHSGRARRRKA